MRHQKSINQSINQTIITLQNNPCKIFFCVPLNCPPRRRRRGPSPARRSPFPRRRVRSRPLPARRIETPPPAARVPRPRRVRRPRFNRLTCARTRRRISCNPFPRAFRFRTKVLRVRGGKVRRRLPLRALRRRVRP